VKGKKTLKVNLFGVNRKRRVDTNLTPRFSLRVIPIEAVRKTEQKEIRKKERYREAK